MIQNVHISSLKNISWIFIISVFFVMVFWPLNSNAQFVDDIVVSVSPELAQGGQDVIITTKSFSFDLKRSEFFWYINDSLKEQGVGESSFELKAPNPGTLSRIDIIIKTTNGRRFSKRVILRPVNLDILWQAHTYTPLFYKGKALPTSDSFIKLIALSEFITTRGARLKPQDLLYSWEQDSIVLGSASGYGKDNIVLRAHTVPPGGTSITLRVSSANGTLQGEKTVRIQAKDPLIKFYRKHPLLGVLYQESIGKTFTLNENEFVLKAEPYFFSLDDIAKNDLEFNWSLNKKSIQPTGKYKNELTLRRETGESGEAHISLVVENMERLLQFAEEKFTILFGRRGFRSF